MQRLSVFRVRPIDNSQSDVLPSLRDLAKISVQHNVSLQTAYEIYKSDNPGLVTNLRHLVYDGLDIYLAP